ncbi:DUF4398 domain-containing protein [Phytopseudomonas dryadis]|uniref:Chromosome partitioning protein ParA n=1 Tax=Phytopseudomonas dryadis TaxID=2487520 RepID=A0A4Q9R761_9GAMM|nr:MULTISPECIES: DUF4398 domain-containing protein [Pseudomonas]TBU96431.1 chromosome partitioning protein ParA [Pseudomonas dryadis]TBV03512.1 chromosome partitioning protein ParA [Pseudomonas dryadis]TBV16564.1 chromosome partitioning protein ParA [Pseudomonas sp. FRB 230]
MELNIMSINTASKARTQLASWKVVALAIGSSLILAGCAGNPPSEQMAVTKSAVNEAVSSGGTEFAAVETKSAQDKLKQAELQIYEKNYKEAKRLAEQAEWDARLAVRKTQAAKAEKALQDAQQGIEELRQEGLRGTQTAPSQGQ